MCNKEVHLLVIRTCDILSYDEELETQNIFTILCNNQFTLNVLSQINLKKSLQNKRRKPVHKRYQK